MKSASHRAENSKIPAEFYKFIFSIVKPTICTSFSNLFYFVVALHMFRSFRPSSGV